MIYTLAATGSSDPIELSNGNEYVALSGTWSGTVVPYLVTPSGAEVPLAAPDFTPISWTVNQAQVLGAPQKSKIKFTFTRTSGTAVIEIFRP
jgi:hypothetical protein